MSKKCFKGSPTPATCDLLQDKEIFQSVTQTASREQQKGCPVGEL